MVVEELAGAREATDREDGPQEVQLKRIKGAVGQASLQDRHLEEMAEEEARTRSVVEEEEGIAQMPEETTRVREDDKVKREEVEQMAHLVALPPKTARSSRELSLRIA